jgi:hypothetical protein
MKYNVSIFKYFILTSILLSKIFYCSSQTIPKIINDKHFKYSFQQFLDSMKVVSSDFEVIDFELRIWQFNWSDGYDKLIQLKRLKNGTWQCEKRNFYFYNNKNCRFSNLSTTYSLKENWNDDWEKIIKANYLNLPDQEGLNAKIKIKDKERLLIADGRSTTLDIITLKSKRSFSYSNPEDYLGFYKEKGIVVKEYIEFINFMDILKKELGF